MSSTRIHVTPSSAGLYDAAGAATAAQTAAIAASQGAWNVVTKTTAYTAVAWDYILADTTGGTFAITVPTPTAGKQWGVKWIAGSVAPTFVGFTSPPTLSALNQGMEFVGDGTVWRQINRPALAQLPDYPTITDARYDASGAASTAQAAAIAASQGAWNTVNKTAAYTAVAWDFVFADTTGGIFAIAAPSPSAGKQFGVKWKAGSVAPTLTGTFNSSPTFSVVDQAIEFISDGSSWYRTVRPALAQIPDYPTLTDARYVQPARQVIAGTGLTGGGDLSADRTLTVAYGTTSTTAAVGNDSRFTTVAATTQGASYILVLADAGTCVEYTGSSAGNITVPPNSSVAFPTGTVIELCQYGAGQITVVAGAGVTLRNSSSLTSRAQYSGLRLRKRATDEWILAGDLS